VRVLLYVLLMRLVVVVAAASQVVAAAMILVRRDAAEVVEDQVVRLTHSHAQPARDRDFGVERTTFGPSEVRRLPDLAANSTTEHGTAAADSVRQLILAHPARADAWQALARLALDGGQPIGRVVSYVDISRMLAPREGRLMVERSLLALDIWPRLEPRQRELALQDLVVTAASKGEIFQIQAYRSALAQMDAPTRTDVLTQVRGYIPLGADAAQRIGPL
jgi:hypothetical protein